MTIRQRYKRLWCMLMKQSLRHTFFIFCLIDPAFASMASSYQEGGSFAQPLHNKATQSLPQNNPRNIPGFETDKPSELTLDKNGNFTDAINQTLHKDDAGKMVIETAKQRSQFKIDPQTDPLFQHYQKTPAEQHLNIQEKSGNDQKETFIQKICEEGGDDITYECFENRHVVPKVPMKKNTLSVNHLNFTAKMVTKNRMAKKGKWYKHAEYEDYTVQDGWNSTLPKNMVAFRNTFCPTFVAKDIENNAVYNIDCSRIKRYQVNNASISESNGIYTLSTPGNFINITLHHDTYEGEAIDEWQSTCEVFEKMVDDGLCQYGERILTQGPETRNIQGYRINKDAWQYKQIYHCKMIKDDCQALKMQGCHQVGSHCKEKQKDRCWIYEQKYQCPHGKVSQPKLKSPLTEAFCMTGDCHDNGYQANGEMLDVISRLNLLKQVQDELRNQGNSNIRVFKGTNYQCTRNCVNFKDCCGGLKGWGVSLHIAGCSAEEKQLSIMREKNLCHLIGTYCSKKVLKKCVSKKTSFCCFGTKFAKILQQQGRSQLGLGWGKIECPDCRGLTVEELSKLDLSKLDFREVFDEVMSKYKEPNQRQLQDHTTKRLQEHFKAIEQGSKKPVPQPGVSNDNKKAL